MREYKTEFENLVKHTEGFFDVFYSSCFISGLKDTIRSDVTMFCPNTMMEILGLAKLVEDKIRAQQCLKSTFVPFINMVPQRHPIPLTPKTTPIKHLSEAEMWARREKGLCYNCNGKFTQGHQCTEKKPYLLDVVSPPALEICEATQDPVDDKVDI